MIERSRPATPIAVSVVGVSKQYRLYRQPSDRLKELLWPRRRWGESFWALREASFDVPKGQVLGLIGPNGSGKSTLLQLITGVLRPTTGAVATNGRVTALLELGAGFNPEFTGRENVLLNGALLGLREAEVRERLPDIIAFAEIGDFIDRPVKTYSSGMYVRLAFSIAANVDPDVLIVDEALAVGDAYFQHRCMGRMHEFRQAGKTILFVSHDTAAVKALCDRAILLDGGRIVDDGPADDVVSHYFALIAEHEFRRPASDGGAAGDAALEAPRDAADDAGAGIERHIPHIDARHGSGAARILGIGCYDAHGRRGDELGVGDPLVVRISVRFARSVARPNIGFVLRDRLGTDLAGTNSTLEGEILPPAEAGTIYTAQFRMALPPLHPGHYAISPTVADGDLHDYTMCDWIENAQVVTIGGRYQTGCVMHPPVTVALVGVNAPQGEQGRVEIHVGQD